MDSIICAAQMLLLQFFPNIAGLQPPVLQKVCAFQVHSGEFVQIVHVGNNHWCVVSTVGCESGAVYVYDSLYKSPTKELIHLIASMMHSQSNELKTTMMDVEKQSNGSDCSFSVCILCVSLSELLLGVIAPRSEVLLVYAYYVSA